MAKSKREIQRYWAKRGVNIPLNHVYTVKENEQRIAAQNQRALENARIEQQELLAQARRDQADLLSAVKDVPKVGRALKSSSYSPAFKTNRSKKDKATAAKGSYQFANQLSMGVGLGGSGIGAGGIGLG